MREAVGLYTPQSQFVMSHDRLMQLGFSGDEIQVICDGKDQEAALEKIVFLLNTGLGEEIN